MYRKWVYVNGGLTAGCAELALVPMERDSSPHKSTALRVGLIALAMCVFRNNGIYVLAVTVVVFLALNHSRIKQASWLLACLIAPAMLAFLVTGPIYSGLGIASGNSLREMMSIPVQQLARVYHLDEPTANREGIVANAPATAHNTRSLSEERKKRIERYFTDDLPNYNVNPSISDLQKAALNTELMVDHPLAFLKLYLGTGIRYPAEYFEAFMMNSLGFWYPNKVYPDIRMYHPLLEIDMIPAKNINENYLELERTSFLPQLESLLRWLIGENAFQNIPPLSSLAMPGTYFFIFVFVCSYCLYNKMRRSAFVLALATGLIITLFLSPVCIYRYCLSLVAISPLLITILFVPQSPAPNIRHTNYCQSGGLHHQPYRVASQIQLLATVLSPVR